MTPRAGTSAGRFGVLALALMTGCSPQQVARTFGDLLSLRDQLVAEYNVPDVSVNLSNGHVLIVSLINSNLNSLSHEERETRAREIAQFVKNHYAGTNSIDTIGVAYVKHANYLIVDYKQTLDWFNFRTADLPAGAPGAEGGSRD